MNLRFKRLRPEAQIPDFAHGDPWNAGLDLALAEARDIGPHGAVWISTGLAWDPDFDYSELEGKRWWPTDLQAASGMIGAPWKPALLIRGRSSMARLGLAVTEGTVDAGYRGEIMVHVWNYGSRYIKLNAGDRVAQAVPVLLPWVSVQEVEELRGSVRGDRGFGSSGA